MGPLFFLIAFVSRFIETILCTIISGACIQIIAHLRRFCLLHFHNSSETRRTFEKELD